MEDIIKFVILVFLIVIQFHQSCAVYPRNHDVHDLIRGYFDLAYTRKDILGFLLFLHHVELSHRSLGRILRRMNLRRNCCEAPVLLIAKKIIELKMQGYNNLGYRSLWKLLNSRFQMRVTQETVRLLLSEIDPDGLRERSRLRLIRRVYINRGPNFLIHIDGYDKLTPYGFPIHGAVDGYSRRILWLKVLPSNKNPSYIARLYMDYLKEIRMVPRVVRADAGTENAYVNKIQVALRSNHNDPMKGHKSFSYGRSTANQRIEMLWSCLMHNFTQFWRNLFRDLIDRNVFNNADHLHIECMRFCFHDIIQNHLDTFCQYWNNHRIRSQRQAVAPSGIPNVLFHQPMRCGTRDFSLPLPCSVTDLSTLCIRLSDPLPFRGCSDAMLQLIEDLSGTLPAEIVGPFSCETAVALFEALISRIEAVRHRR